MEASRAKVRRKGLSLSASSLPKWEPDWESDQAEGRQEKQADMQKKKKKKRVSFVEEPAKQRDMQKMKKTVSCVKEVEEAVKRQEKEADLQEKKKVEKVEWGELQDSDDDKFHASLGCGASAPPPKATPPPSQTPQPLPKATPQVYHKKNETYQKEVSTTCNCGPKWFWVIISGSFTCPVILAGLLTGS